ncbi:hypothetical protein KY332_00240 [Candidatus Woesearchaeota archaeon]|nr:hypothetical protein [Candidatus Woesearchaeota archaeon]
MGIKIGLENKMKRLAYLDNDLETEGYCFKGGDLVPLTESKAYQNAMKTISFLEDVFEVDSFPGLNEETSKEAVKRHEENPYSIMIATITRQKVPTKRFAGFRCERIFYYDEGYELLEKTAEQMPGVSVIIYLDEAMDIIDSGLRKKWDYTIVQKKYDSYDDLWRYNMDNISKAILEADNNERQKNN